MANPQVSEGYTRIANEVIKALIKYITNPTWLRISLLVIRLTYGYHKTETESNYIAFANWLNLTEDYVKRILLEMQDVNIIWYTHSSPTKFKIKFNKNYENWKVYK